MWAKAALIAAWLGLLGAGFGKLWVYSRTPLPLAAASPEWPAQSVLARDARPTLVVFLHPRCPCSRASVGELERMMPDLQGKFRVHLEFLRPPGRSDSWVRGSLWRSAVAVPGFELHEDSGGIEARRFGARVSGEAFLFAPQRGRLVFHGGLTPARGHHGESVGRTAVLAYAESGRAPASASPAFGCALFSREDLESDPENENKKEL